MTYPDFKDRWQLSGGAERANYGLFLQDLCALIGVAPPDPTTDNPAQDAYVLERAVEFVAGDKKSVGRIDLYKRDCFVLETKQGTDTSDQQKLAERAELGFSPEKKRKGHAVRGSVKWEQMMQAARQQALGYVRALPPDEPRPPFVLVVDVGYCIDVYSNFTGVGDTFVPFPDQTRYRLSLASLAGADTLAMLRRVFADPRALDPSRRAARVTRELAGYPAQLSAQLERAGHAPDAVAQFLMRCLFTMFSEDVGLIPKASFTGLLQDYSPDELRPFLPDALQNLWEVMDKGGFSSGLKARLPRFNGKLFHDATALPLNADQVALLVKAGRADWTTVEPAIFGTLLERALDPRERHKLGAHYTPRRYVERLVLPTVLEPLRREWTAAQAAAARLLDENKPKESRAELLRFLTRLTSLRILDPACGSGNFLYVTLEHLKRLEGEVLAAINSYGQTAVLDLGGGTTVSPRQLLGLELNPRAAAIADVVLKIGYLQWHLRTNGMSELREPLLDEYENIRQQDAALQHDPPVPRLDASGQPVTRWDGITTKLHPATGQPVPDDTAQTLVYDYPNPTPAPWQETATERFGFITTNSLKQTFNRRVMQPFLDGENPKLTLTFAIPDHPWVDSAEGAAVRIAMTVAEPATTTNGRLLTVLTEDVPKGEEASEVTFAEEVGRILPDLTIGAELDSAKALKANEGLSNRGFEPGNSGFIIQKEQAESFGLKKDSGLSAYVRAYRNGRDLTDKPRNVYAIDLFGLNESEVLEKFPNIYQHLLQTVKPEREQNRDVRLKTYWWLHRRSREDLRKALFELPRFIATVETAKHRIFQFLDAEILPDNKLVAIALDDAYHLGILSSRTHIVWVLATGSTLEDRPVYVKTKSFDPFPFPDASPTQQTRIRALAEQLDAHRKRQQAQHAKLTLTDLYNVVEKLKTGEALSAKEQLINQQGLASVVLSLHQQLDAAVSDAYG